MPKLRLAVLDDVKVVVTSTRTHVFHGLEIPIRTLNGARALRIVHPAGQVIPPHRHDWPLLTLPALGGYEEQTEDGSIGVAGPAVVLHPPGRCHANSIHPQGMETFSVEFDPTWLGLSRRDALFDRSFYWIGGPVSLSSRALARSWRDPQSTERDLQRATGSFLRMAMISQRSPRPPWLDTVRMQIGADECATASTIASHLGVHPRWLAHAYRQTVGEGIHDTILRRRIEQAAYLLRSTGQPIAEIALATGFCDQSHLNRVLGRFTGRTPAQVRAERLQLQALVS